MASKLVSLPKRLFGGHHLTGLDRPKSDDGQTVSATSSPTVLPTPPTAKSERSPPKQSTSTTTPSPTASYQPPQSQLHAPPTLPAQSENIAAPPPRGYAETRLRKRDARLVKEIAESTKPPADNIARAQVPPLVLPVTGTQAGSGPRSLSFDPSSTIVRLALRNQLAVLKYIPKVEATKTTSPQSFNSALKRSYIDCSLCGICFSLDQRLYDHDVAEYKGKRSIAISREQVLIPARFLDLFKKSAQLGCQICDLIEQAWSLLSRPDLPVELRLYDDSPIMIGSSSMIQLEIYTSTKTLGTPASLSIPESRTLFSPNLHWTSTLKRALQLKDVPSRSGSEDSFNFLITKYNTCRQTHKSCQQLESLLPKRVIDVSGPLLRLIEPGGQQKGTYAALSYCWGDQPHFMTTIENLSDMKRGVDWKKVPLVFRDAATIARKLAIKFLWIDAICIIQKDVTEWRSEAMKMASIYENSSITIAASSSQHSMDPFLGDRKWKAREVLLRMDDCPVQFRARDSIKLGHHFAHPLDQKDPLDLRAWAFQERELSTRLVSYTSAEIQWRCKTIHSCECCTADFTISGPTSFLQSEILPEIELQSCSIWHKVVQEYTSRQLTKMHDKLPAIMGIAMKFREEGRSNFIYGLWEATFITDLSWTREHHGYIESQFKPRGTWSGPSYSWASIPGPVTYQLARVDYPGKRIWHTRLICSPYLMNSIVPDLDTNADKYASLILCGPTVIGSLWSDESVDNYRIHLEGQVAEMRCFIDAPFTPDILSHGKTLEPGSSKQNLDGQLPMFQEFPIKLLSLFSLVDEAAGDCYEITLILRLSTEKSWKRVGLAEIDRKLRKISSDDPVQRPTKPFGMLKHKSGRSFDVVTADRIIVA